jgi:hypothetical protein
MERSFACAAPLDNDRIFAPRAATNKMSRAVVIAHSDESEELFSYYAMHQPPIVMRADKPSDVAPAAAPAKLADRAAPPTNKRARKTEAQRLAETWEAIRHK